MRVIPVEEWTVDGEYQPVARINKPISDFALKFDAAVAPLKSGTPGLRFLSEGRQFILREVASDNTTELLVSLVDMTKTPRSVDKVEESFVAAVKDLNLRLQNMTTLHKGLKVDRLETRLGFGLNGDRVTIDFTPIEP